MRTSKTRRLKEAEERLQALASGQSPAPAVLAMRANVVVDDELADFMATALPVLGEKVDILVNVVGGFRLGGYLPVYATGKRTAIYLDALLTNLRTLQR